MRAWRSRRWATSTRTRPAARRPPGIAAATGLVVDWVDGHLLAAHCLDNAGRSRLDEIAAVARGPHAGARST